ncbi:MAG: hypothetical protein FWH38_01815 [Treponema sp.]|nr:hypothetical protein [Treponema sp.]
MDDRKKRINELELRNKEQIVLLDAQLIRLGEAIIRRAGDSFQDDASSFDGLSDYRRLQNDIDGSQASIQAVEEQVRRFKEIEESIEAREREDGACAKELTVVYGRLGKLLLEAPAPADSSITEGGQGAGYADFCAPYREQAEALHTKVLSLEDRLSDLEEKEGGNVFTWIGKSAQSLVLRSFLTKAQDNLELLRGNIGERYSRSAAAGSPGAETGEIEGLCAEIEEKRSRADALSQNLAGLRDEKKKISGSFSAEGGPLKQIQSLKNHISRDKDELRALYRRIGAEAAAVGGECGKDLAPFVLPGDRETLDSAARISQVIQDGEKAMEKLRASLSIDEEKAKIEKYRRMILDRKDKIAQAEKNITEFERGIAESEKQIEKLHELL